MEPAKNDTVEFADVEFDPSIDTSNMDQYNSKVYKVVPVYEKRQEKPAPEEPGEEDPEKQALQPGKASPPAYEEAFPPPAYQEKTEFPGNFRRESPYEVAPEDLQAAEKPAPGRAHRVMWILFLWFFFMEMLYVPMDCDESQTMPMGPGAYGSVSEEDMPYNIATVVYFRTSVDAADDCDMMN